MSQDSELFLVTLTQLSKLSHFYLDVLLKGFIVLFHKLHKLLIILDLITSVIDLLQYLLMLLNLQHGLLLLVGGPRKLDI